MRTTCIINNYNYGRFLPDAVESALAQTVPFDEIIIVDDGSTDESRAIVQERWGNCARVAVVLQENRGQMAALNAGYERSKGDLICLLDADDIYAPDYLERTLEFYRSHPACNFSFCAYEKFGSLEERVFLYPEDTDLGITAVLVDALKTWIGGPTSTLSMLRQVADQILPYPYPDDWRNRADDMLVWGTSLVGSQKFYHAVSLVRYRVHGENAWHGRTFDPAVRLRRELAKERLFSFYRSKLGFSDCIYDLAYLEFRTHPCPTYKLLMDYWRIVRKSKVSFFLKLKRRGALVLHYFAARRKPSR